MSKTTISSKKGIVSLPPSQMYMTFTDPRNIVNMLPSDKKEGVEADFDTAKFNVQNIPVGVKVTERTPYSRIVYSENGAPVVFDLSLNFHEVPGESWKTEFSMDLDAEIPFFMLPFKGKIEKILNALVDALATGKMPEDIKDFM